MVDANPLVDYMYETAIEHYLQSLREGLAMGVQNDITLLKSMYSELSSISGSPLINQHVNVYYTSVRDEWINCQNNAPLRIPSKVYYFHNAISPNGSVWTGDVTDDLCDCVILCYPWPCGGVTSSKLLSLCHKISQHQQVSDIAIYNLTCDDVEEIDCFNVSKYCKSIDVTDCSIPPQVLFHLQQQLCQCHELQILSFHGTRIESPLFLNSLNQMTSLKCLNLHNTGIDSETCEKVCKRFKYLKHLKEIFFVKMSCWIVCNAPY